MSTTRDTFTSIVRSISELLRVEGYARRGNIYIKQCESGAILLLVHVQESQYSDHECIEFTLNLGVFSRRLHRRIWGKQTEGGIIWYAPIRERIGLLLPSPKDTWWTIESATDPVLRFAEIAGCLTLVGLPFLRRFRSEADIAEYLWSCIRKGTASYQDAINLLHLKVLQQDAKGIMRVQTVVRKSGQLAGVPVPSIEESIVSALKPRRPK